MFNIISSGLWSSEATWVAFSARQRVQEAITALEEASAALVPLISASQWHAQGVMALHELICDLRARAVSEVGVLEIRVAEIDRLAAS